MSFFTIDKAGLISVDTSEILNDFQNAYRRALGSDLNLDSSTVQGQLITQDVDVITQVQSDLTELANLSSPFYATGAALDTAGAIFGYYRKQGTRTVVYARVGGVPGTFLPVGSLASSSEGEFRSVMDATIDTTGIAYVQFESLTVGFITCLIGELNTVIGDPNRVPIDGWDTITNNNDGVVGRDIESDGAFRSRITKNQLNVRAFTTLGAIDDTISQINDVVSVLCRENPTGANMVIDGVTLPPHSLLVSPLGGEDNAIAYAMALKKTIGCDTVGSDKIHYNDRTAMYTYEYNIYRPETVKVYAQVTYRKNVFVGTGIEDKIIGLIMDYIYNNPFQVGMVVSGNMLAESIVDFDEVEILSFKLSLDNTIWQDYIDPTIVQVVSISQEDISTVEVDV